MNNPTNINTAARLAVRANDKTKHLDTGNINVIVQKAMEKMGLPTEP